MNIACVLASWRPDEPAGMERSVAALVTGLRSLGHNAFVITAAPQPAPSDAIVLRSLAVRFPCDDPALRAAIIRAGNALQDELTTILRTHNVDVVYYVDALWGLGLAATMQHQARRVLGLHVVGQHDDLMAALHRVDAVLAPSEKVLQEAARAGYLTTTWKVAPNGLLIADPSYPDHDRRQALRQTGPLRAIARLGPEKGLDHLIDATAGIDRPVNIAAATAAFELEPGSQQHLLERYQKTAATTPNVTIHPGLSWADVPPWLADAAAAIVPSQRETFGLVALEALSVGTPVIAYAVGNLPDLIGDTGATAPSEQGPAGLRAATRALLTDPLRYDHASRAARQKAYHYRPEKIAHHWLETAYT